MKDYNEAEKVIERLFIILGVIIIIFFMAWAIYANGYLHGINDMAAACT